MAAGMESCSKPLVCEITRTCFRWICLPWGAGGMLGFGADCAHARLLNTAMAIRLQARVRKLRPRRKVFPLLHELVAVGDSVPAANGLGAAQSAAVRSGFPTGK